MKSKYFFAFLITLIASAFIILNLKKNADVQLGNTLRSSSAFGDSSEIPPDLIIQSQHRQAALKRSLDDVMAHFEDAGSEAKSTRQALRLGFKNLLAISEYFDKDESEQTIFVALSQKGNAKDEIVRSLTEINYASQAFGDEQDIIRYYGIKYLEYLAKNGDSEPLDIALAKLSHVLITEKTWMKGQWSDLEDLLRANLALREFSDEYSLSEFFDSKGIPIRDLDIDKHEEYLSTIMHGAYSGLRQKLSHKQAEAELIKTMPSYFRG